MGSALERTFWLALWFPEEAWSHSAQPALVCGRGQSTCPSVSVSVPYKRGWCCSPRQSSWQLNAVRSTCARAGTRARTAGPLALVLWRAPPALPLPLRAERPRPLSPGSLLDRTGKILIPGLSEAVAPVTQEELQLYDEIDFDLEEYAKDVGAETLLHSCKVPRPPRAPGGGRRGWRRRGRIACLAVGWCSTPPGRGWELLGNVQSWLRRHGLEDVC